MMQPILKTTAAVAFCAIAAEPAFAQQGEQTRSRRGQQQQQQGQVQPNQGQQRRQNQSRQGQQQNGATPMAWVRVAYDYDDDGAWDAFEYIYAWDLEQAQRSSQRRQGQQSSSHSGSRRMAQPGQGQPFVGDSGQSGMQGSGPQHELRGSVQSVTTKSYFGTKEPHVFARVRTEQGRTARVDLGPRSQVVQVQQGDQVTLFGRRGTVNGRGTFMAEEIERDGRTVQIDRSQNTDAGPPLRKIRGTLRSTRQVAFNETPNQHVLGLVQPMGASSGEQRSQQGLLLIDFGPQDQLSQLSLREGDEVLVLATPGRVQGKSAMIAESVCVDGQTVDLRRSADARASATSSSMRSGSGARD